MALCVYVCVRMRACVCVCTRVRVCVRACVRVCVSPTWQERVAADDDSIVPMRLSRPHQQGRGGDEYDYDDGVEVRCQHGG